MWSGGRTRAVLHVRPQRRGEHLDAAARRPRATSGHAIPGRTRTVAGPISAMGARWSSSATSASGRSTWRPARATRCRFARRGAPSVPSPRPSLSDRLSELALSPDGTQGGVRRARRNLRGSRPATAATATRVTNTVANESQIEWAPDSRRIVYVSERDDVTHIFMYDFTTERGDPGDARRQGRPSAEVLAGRHEAGVRPRRQVRCVILDLASGKQERIVASGHFISASRRPTSRCGRRTTGGSRTSD